MKKEKKEGRKGEKEEGGERKQKDLFSETIKRCSNKLEGTLTNGQA